MLLNNILQFNKYSNAPNNPLRHTIKSYKSLYGRNCLEQYVVGVNRSSQKYKFKTLQLKYQIQLKYKLNL